MAADVEEICPAVEVLTSIETAVPCTVEGCSKILCNTASLRMHVVKTHNITASEEEKGLFTRNSEKRKGAKKHYYCPVLDCSRGKYRGKPFPRLGQLKQHYMTVHAEKQHTCKKCHRGFGLLAACKRHESKCGQVFHCSCGCPFTTREALLMHLRRKEHSLPAKEQVPVTSSVQNNRKTTKVTTPAIQATKGAALIATQDKQEKGKVPIPLRYCNILPKPEYLSKNQHLSNMQEPSTRPVECGGFNIVKQDTQTQTSMPKCYKNTSTQTVLDIPTFLNDDAINAENGTNYANVGTQANKLVLNSVSSMIDFSSQVIVSDIGGNMSHSSSIGIQHDNHLFMNSNLDVQGDPTCFSLRSQALLDGESGLQITDPRFLSSSETQTQDFDQVALEDNSAQTSISIFGFDPSVSTDCGTQTQAQRIFDELWSQSDVEFTESQTQTWLSSLMPEISSPNHELNTRNTLEELVNIQTQTPGITSNDVPFDVGLTNTETQTIPEAFSSNSWAFESINTQTQMTQTATDSAMYNQLMDTHTQTFLDDIDVSVFSSVQTQT